MTNTPRTDANEFYYDGRTGFVELSFAKQLERELTAEKARAEKWKACAGDLYHSIDHDREDQESSMQYYGQLLREENGAGIPEIHGAETQKP